MDEKIKEADKTEPNQHNLLAEVPKRRFGKMFAILIASLVVVTLAGAAAWYFVINKTEPAPVVQQNSEPELEPEAEQAPAYLIAGYKLDEKTKEYSTGVFQLNFAEREARELFSRSGISWADIIGVSDDGVYFTTVAKDGYTHEVSKYDKDTKKTEVLAKAVNDKDILTGFLLSPDKTKILYAEGCGSTCTDEQNRGHSDIKSITLATGKIETVHSFRAGRTWFTHGAEWSSDDLVLLGYSCECDGVGDMPYAELLDMDNGNLITVSFKQPVRYMTVSPDGKTLLANRFKVDKAEEESSYTSSVITKDIISGEERVILSSTKQFFNQFEWLTNSEIIGSSTNATIVKRGLGYYAEGTQDLSVYTLGDEVKRNEIVSQAKNPGIYGFSYPYIAFAEEWPFGQGVVAIKSMTIKNLETEDEFQLPVPSIYSALITK